MVIEQTLQQQFSAEKSKESALSPNITRFLAELIGSESLAQPIVLKRASQLSSLPQWEALNVESVHADYLEDRPCRPCVIIQERINDLRYINKFMESVNAYLPEGGFFIGCVETAALRKKALQNKVGTAIATPIHFVDYLFKRVAPKLPLTKKVYFAITKGRNRVISSGIFCIFIIWQIIGPKKALNQSFRDWFVFLQKYMMKFRSKSNRQFNPGEKI